MKYEQILFDDDDLY